MLTNVGTFRALGVEETSPDGVHIHLGLALVLLRHCCPDHGGRCEVLHLEKQGVGDRAVDLLTRREFLLIVVVDLRFYGLDLLEIVVVR